MSAPRVLVIEDDATWQEAIAQALGDEGFEVRSEAGGSSVEHVLATFRPDIILLDLDLGEGPDGLQVARRIRSCSDVPILMETGADAVADELAGFAMGADDYLAKPFAMESLVARVRSILHRSGKAPRRLWTVGEMVIDADAHTVSVNDQLVELTSIEFDLLVVLCRNVGRVLAKVQLLSEVWGFDQYSLNLVEVHVSSLRRKLEAHGPRMIRTVRNVGYVLRP